MDPAEIIRIKELLPTTLGSEDIREQIARDILQRSLFSARMASIPYLRRLREVCEQVVAGSINQADARNMLQAALEGLGYNYDDPGGIQNPMSARRLNLIIDTQRQMAASVATLAEQTPAVVDAYPAWELTRLVDRAPRRKRSLGAVSTVPIRALSRLRVLRYGKHWAMARAASMTPWVIPTLHLPTIPAWRGSTWIGTRR